MLNANAYSIFAVVAIVLILLEIRKYTRIKPHANDLPWVLISPPRSVLPYQGQTFSIYTTKETHAVLSVRQQSKQKGVVILWVGFTKKRGFSNFRAMVDEAIHYRNIGYVYLYEELFWEPPGRLALGYNEKEILEANTYARRNGLMTIVSIMPDVVLHPDFKLKTINAYSVICIVDHPSVNPTIRLNDNIKKCGFSDNLTTNLMYLSLKKLHELGFTGQVWYAYQAFGLNSISPIDLKKDLSLQRETLKRGDILGFSALVPYGLYFGEPELLRKPDLFQGAESAIEPFVRPPTVNS
jgi:hypothetical protein